MILKKRGCEIKSASLDAAGKLSFVLTITNFGKSIPNTVFQFATDSGLTQRFHDTTNSIVWRSRDLKALFDLEDGTDHDAAGLTAVDGNEISATGATLVGFSTSTLEDDGSIDFDISDFPTEALRHKRCM